MTKTLLLITISLALVGGEVTASRDETRSLLAGILRADGTAAREVMKKLSEETAQKN